MDGSFELEVSREVQRRLDVELKQARVALAAKDERIAELQEKLLRQADEHNAALRERHARIAELEAALRSIHDGGTVELGDLVDDEDEESARYVCEWCGTSWGDRHEPDEYHAKDCPSFIARRALGKGEA